MAADGGRPRRVTENLMDGGFPTWSPDGSKIAFTGHIGPGPQAGRDVHLLWVPVDRSAAPARVAPALDRPTGLSLTGRCFASIGPEELLFSVVDRGTIAAHRRHVAGRDEYAGDRRRGPGHGPRRGRRGGRLFVGVARRAGRGLVRAARRSTQAPQRGRGPAAGLCAPDWRRPVLGYLVRRTRHRYWVMRPPARRGQGKPPLYLEIHGGPQLYNPIPHLFTYYQALAGAGYLVVMPNPRGSVGYGEDFDAAGPGRLGRRRF